ncbi:copper amine oxidase N-terminal domain-containing protein [Paenibacillus sp. MMS18-CY102]|uniref:copper amine oxidase N-terminal domain-containing protein n=1 Tax=Paenibacillus sp. MMS18-CY102 TaxID=2682849 RepID=UPI001365268E|nr:copper amine oxidase N-terminal domain-containing protein [Paenibacillus sp. MMS18-CY102]MWC30293.1 hypothetical protein [Paenibacillus sp. MMS18-CY102]
MRRHRWMIVTAVILLIFVIKGSVEAAAGGKEGTGQSTAWLKLTIDGRPIADKPYLNKGTTMVPVAPIAAALGGKVEDAIDKTKVQWGDMAVILASGTKEATINGGEVLLPEVPVKLNGKLYLPFKAIVNVFGINAGYKPNEKTVELTTKNKKAIIYGYAVDKYGQPVTRGEIYLSSFSPKLVGYELRFWNGFYRIEVEEGTYSARLKINDYTFNLPDINVQIRNNDRVFVHLAQPKPNLMINVHYEDGQPVEYGSLVLRLNGREAKIEIDQGKAEYKVSEKGQLFIDEISVNNSNYNEWDVYELYDVDPNERNKAVDVVVHRPNVRLQAKNNGKLQNGAMELQYPQLAMQFSPLYNLWEGEIVLYLPIGTYHWVNFTSYSNGQKFKIDKAITITDENVNTATVIVWEMPDSFISGNVQFMKGSSAIAISDIDELVFSTVADFSVPPVASVSIEPDGSYDAYLPDGNYYVFYRSIGKMLQIISDMFVVADGKAASPNFVIKID